MDDQKRNLGKSLRGVFKYFDLYGHNVNLLINKKPKFHSTCSGMASVGIIVIILYTLTGFISSWLNKQKLTIISSSLSYSVNGLLSTNETDEYTFGYDNYAIYFVVFANLPNGTVLSSTQITPYFTYEYTYKLDSFQNEEPIQHEPCRVDLQDEFLGLGKEQIMADQGQQNVHRICIKNPYLMGLLTNQSYQSVEQPQFSFYVYKCVNSTSNNNSCASPEAITEMLTLVQVQITIPNTLFDFNNVENPKITSYNFQNIPLDPSMAKIYQNNLIPTFLYTDQGLINDDYVLDSVSFNPQLFYDPKIINEDSDPLFEFTTNVDLKKQIYYRRNSKLNEIMGSIGGLINSIFLIGKVFCMTYNYIYLRFKIIKSAFQNKPYLRSTSSIAPKNSDPTKTSAKTLQTKKTVNTFSYCSYLFPSKELRSFYQRGNRSLYEYLDIRKIIKRLQDLDKLKMVLLNENQRKLFEFIPKPDLMDTSKKSSLHSVLKYKAKMKTNKTNPNLSSNFKQLTQDDDPINKRILECLDPKLKDEVSVEENNKSAMDQSFVGLPQNFEPKKLQIQLKQPQNRSPIMADLEKSEFHKLRSNYHPRMPKILNAEQLEVQTHAVPTLAEIKAIFPFLCKEDPRAISFQEVKKDESVIPKPLRVGVVLSGGQAPGGHNVIVGVYEAIKRRHPNSQLFGFLNGPASIFNGKYIEIREDLIGYYKNRGGFDMICSGRDKIETPEQFAKSKGHCDALNLDGLIVIGGDDSNTNACLLAEYFAKENCRTRIVGCPKTIDGDLKNEYVETSFGFDTACKTYAEMIGNICLDTLSSKKYYHFVRMMGRSASHIALESALLTRVNYCFIGEEIFEKKQTLQTLVQDLVNVIVKRAASGKNYGVILVPEGLIEFICEMRVLITDLSTILAKSLTEEEKKKEVGELYGIVSKHLSKENVQLMEFLPQAIREQLLLDRDPHGNVNVSRIETEKLLITMIQTELEKLEKEGKYKGNFTTQCHFFGYEGRCAFPTTFDCDYCYCLGVNAAVLVEKGFSGVMSVASNLSDEPENWKVGGYPLVTMMNVEKRKGKDVPVIKKALVDLDGPIFKFFASEREKWALGDYFCPPGPIQFERPGRCPFLVKAPSHEEFYLKQYSKKYDPKNSPYICIDPSINLSPLGLEKAREEKPLAAFLDNGQYDIYLGQKIDFANDETRDAAIASYKNIMSLDFSRRYVEIVPKGHVNKSALSHELEYLEKRKGGLKIAVMFSGRQAPGGHSIIEGLLTFTKKNKGVLLGFIDGTKGLLEGNTIVVNDDNFEFFRSQGGFHFLGRSFDKLRNPEECEKAKKTLTNMGIDGLVMIGASHTLTDALIFSDYLVKVNCPTRIVVVPASIDNNIAHNLIETTVGFDTASKVYSQLIGNIMNDAASSVKYWYFIRLMGRDPSHLVLECALQTHPNVVIISEEVEHRSQGLYEIVNEIADVVVARGAQGKDFGTVLVPEGLLPHIPVLKTMIEELNRFFSGIHDKHEAFKIGEKLCRDEPVAGLELTPWSSAAFQSLPDFTKKQLVLERDTSGEIQLSQIETERLLAHLVSLELKKRKANKEYKGNFAPLCHFFGYQGRCAFPSNFDNTLGNSYGFLSGILVEAGLTGFCVTNRGLTGKIDDWYSGAIPLVSMTVHKPKSIYGTNEAIIASSDVNLSKEPFQKYKRECESWKLSNNFLNPGPIQLYGPLADNLTWTLRISYHNYIECVKKIEELTEKIRGTCRFGIHQNLLNVAVINLESLLKIINFINKDLKPE